MFKIEGCGNFFNLFLLFFLALFRYNESGFLLIMLVDQVEQMIIFVLISKEVGL